MFRFLPRTTTTAASRHSHSNGRVTNSFNDDILVGEYLDPHMKLKDALTGDLKASVESCQLDPKKVEKGRLVSRGELLFMFLFRFV